MRSINLSAATWRKSSYSNQDGGECVEVCDDFVLGAAAWRKSSYSNSDGGACVEVCDDLVGVLAVRDSKNPHGPALAFPTTRWTAFVSAVKVGRLTA